MKHVLVTGGAGFIGIHLCQRLLADGCYVTCMDDFSSGNREWTMELCQQSCFDIIEHDVAIPFDVKVDEVYHLACPASPLFYQKNPVKTLKTNILGAINVLELAKKRGIPVLLASTSEVYGDPLVHPQKEHYWGNVNPVGIRSCYNEGKRCAESLFMDYQRQYGVISKIARIFNTYGPYLYPDDGRVISNFILQALNGTDITIYGTGMQTRSFCYVTDLVDGLYRLMNTSEAVTGPINLGNPMESTINEIADLILHLTDSSSKKGFEPLPSDDPKKRKPCIDIAEKVLGWKPKISLEEGLAETIKYFQQFLSLSGNSI